MSTPSVWRQERDTSKPSLIKDRALEPTAEGLESALCPCGESRCSQEPHQGPVTLTAKRQLVSGQCLNDVTVPNSVHLQ